MSASASIPMEGVLNCWNDEHDLPDLLLSVSRSNKTGRLSFANPEADKTLYVKDGKIIFAESTSEDDGFGQFLLRTGQISLMDYLRVSRRVEPNKRLGALLVEEGVLEPKALVPAVMGQVRAIILGLFRRTETWYRFKEEELPHKEAITLDMPVSQLILDGVQYVESWRRVSKGVGTLDSIYRLLPEASVEWGRLDLGDGVSELLDMLKRPVSVDFICTHASIPDFDACRYLWAFRCLGWIEKQEAAADGEDVTTAPEVVPAETVAKPKAIPQQLIETRVAVEPPKPKADAASKPASAPAAAPPSPAASKPSPPAEPPPSPRPGIQELAQTRLDVEPPSPPAEPKTQTTPDVSAPRKPIAEELLHTQLFTEPAALEESLEDPEPGPPSPGEMMEAILEGGDARPSSSPPRPEPPKPPAPSAPAPVSPATTQFFDGASAIEPPDASEAHDLEDTEEPETDGPAFGFEALAVSDPESVPPPSAAVTTPSLRTPPPPESEPEHEQRMPSFDELDYDADEPDPAVPVVEASVVEGVEVVEAEDAGLPMVEPEAVAADEPADPTSGMEAFATSDPFPSDEPLSFESLGFESDDPVSAPHAPPSKHDRRPPSPEDEVELDNEGLSHLFRSDG